jgi:hypothetical protein
MRTEKRTIGVSDRIYRILSYGVKVYRESIGEYLERFMDSMCEREKAKELFSTLEKQIKTDSTVSESEHLKLINEGLSLIREFSPEKAKELEERLAQIRKEKSTVE